MTETISNAEAIAISILLVVIILFGCLLNGLIVATYVRWHRQLLKQATDVFILSLALGHLLMSVLVCPLAFASAVSTKWTTGQGGCIYYGFLSVWFGLHSMLQLTAMAVERSITLSQLTLRTVSMTRAFQVTAGCWFIAFVASCFPLIGWSKYTFDGYGLHCAIFWNSQTLNNSSYNIFLLVVFFLIPITVMLFSYAKIYLSVRRIYINAGETWGMHAQATKDSYIAQVMVAKQFLIVISGFLFAWSPYAVLSMLKTIGGFDLSLAYHEYPGLCAKMSVIYNPLIYLLTYSRLRVKAKRMLVRTSRNRVFPYSDNPTTTN